MVTDAQVRLLRQKLMEGKTQEAASAAAGMSVRTARAWQDGPLPSQTKTARAWRTRIDPFAEVWERDIEPLLAADSRGVLDGTTLMAVLDERYPGRFGAGQLRTLQRRLRDWRAQHGPTKAGDRRQRRVDRLLRASKLPPGKTFDVLQDKRLPRPLWQTAREHAAIEKGSQLLLYETGHACGATVELGSGLQECREVLLYHAVQHALLGPAARVARARPRVAVRMRAA